MAQQTVVSFHFQVINPTKVDLDCDFFTLLLPSELSEHRSCIARILHNSHHKFLSAVTVCVHAKNEFAVSSWQIRFKIRRGECCFLSPQKTFLSCLARFTLATSVKEKALQIGKAIGSALRLGLPLTWAGHQIWTANGAEARNEIESVRRKRPILLGKRFC